MGIRRGELLRIQWPQVDLEHGTITLNAGETKNEDARVVPILDGDMRNLLEAAKKDRDEFFPGCPWVFSRGGERIKDFRRSWDEAMKRAGAVMPSGELLRFHDLRRSAARNMRRAGVPQVVIMRIMGHRTDSMFRRYSIVDTEDVMVAKERMQNRTRKCNPQPYDQPA